MNTRANLTTTIIKKTLRVPAGATSGDSSKLAIQLDSALMSIGFTMSKDLAHHIAHLHPTAALELSQNVLTAVKELLGDNVEYNVYFRDFPKNVPDTQEFWADLINKALLDPDKASKIAAQLQMGSVNLLDLPTYGAYQHTYDEMLASREPFVSSIKDKVKMLHLGLTLEEEAYRLYSSLAESAIPLNEDDREILKTFAEVCIGGEQPDNVRVRENKAIINAVRLSNGRDLLVDTPTDFLRLAAQLSDGDVTLVEKTKFKSLSRASRRNFLRRLNEIIEASPAKLADVLPYAEQWKRLGERLKPHEYSYRAAQDVFAVARGEKKMQSITGKVEQKFSEGDLEGAISLLSTAPGLLYRSLDRLLVDGADASSLLAAVKKTTSKVSGKVLLSVAEHLENRLNKLSKHRIFANTKGRAWVADEARDIFTDESRVAVNMILMAINNEIQNRVKTVSHPTVSRDVLNVALPLSNKNTASGFNVMPRGTVEPVATGILRFFVYWRQKQQRTDFDLSMLLLDKNLKMVAQSSFTSLTGMGYTHSGDITSAPKGASEFIDVDLTKVSKNVAYLIPQVNVYSGEDFNDVEESFFGFMERTEEQKGKPFEAKTVKNRADLRGDGKIALPLAFAKGKDESWNAKWVNLFLKGSPNFNQVEGNHVTTSLLVKAMMDRENITVNYIVNALMNTNENFAWYEGQELDPETPITFIGREVPEGLPEGSKTITLTNLHELIPE